MRTTKKLERPFCPISRPSGSTWMALQLPTTEALLQQKLRSLGPIESWWYEKLWDGAPTRGHDGWETSVEKRQIQNDYIEHANLIGLRRKSVATELGAKLHELVPGIRTSRISTASGRRWAYLFPPLAECRRV